MPSENPPALHGTLNIRPTAQNRASVESLGFRRGEDLKLDIYSDSNLGFIVNLYRGDLNSPAAPVIHTIKIDRAGKLTVGGKEIPE